MVISKIWLSLLCSSVACNTDTEAPLVQLYPGTTVMQTGQTPQSQQGEGGLAKFRATLPLSSSPKQRNHRDAACPGPHSPEHRSGQRSPRTGLSGISPPLAASVPAPAPPRQRCLLKQRGDGSQLLLTQKDHRIPTSPADSMDLGITGKPRRRSPGSGFGTSLSQGHHEGQAEL